MQIEELLAALPEGAPFVSTAGQVFVTLPGGQTFPLASPYFRDWLTNEYMKLHNEPPTEHAVYQAVRILRAQAHAKPRLLPVDVRVVARPKTDYAPAAIFIDLANAAGDTVQITPTGWQIARTLEVAFRTSRGQLPLPRPELPSDNDASQEFLTSRLLDFLISSLNPMGPYPILVLQGPPGSGKTTTARMLRALIDPITAPIQPLPSRGREVFQQAVRDRVLVFDHVTRMSNSVVDALCQISSGTAVTVREPGDRNREPLRLDIARPVILTTPRCGASDWQPRPDLAARIITIEMPKIKNPRPAAELWAEFESARPTLLAALYTALSNSLPSSPSPVPTAPDAEPHTPHAVPSPPTPDAQLPTPDSRLPTSVRSTPPSAPKYPRTGMVAKRAPPIS